MTKTLWIKTTLDPTVDTKQINTGKSIVLNETNSI